MPKQIEIKLRAFSLLQKTDITNIGSEIVAMLDDKLKITLAKDRLLKRSSSKEDKEHDLISSSKLDNNTVFGVMLRVELDSTSPQVPSDLLAAQSFELSDLQVGEDENTIYKNHYYFCLNNSHVVTNLPRNTTIIGFQTYINWLLNTATTPYEITPLCKSTPDFKLADIKEIVFEDDSILLSSQKTSKTAIDDTSDRLIDIAWGGVRKLLTDTVDLTEEEIKNVISARLLLKFRKPKSMSEEDYRKKFGAMLKPVSDTEHLHYVSKSGQRLTAETITVVKPICIETTGRGFLAEEQLRQAMILFLNEQSAK